MQKFWDWVASAVTMRRWHVTALWLAVVALAAACGYQQGRIAANHEYIQQNHEFNQSALDGIGRIEAKLQAISFIRAEGGTAVIITPSESITRSLLVDEYRRQIEEEIDGRLHTASGAD